MPYTCSLFQGYGDHRDLHSFPTRRSSDLKTRVRQTNRRAPQQPKRRRRLCPRGKSDCRAPPTHRQGARDRKSTRLNSSHRCISYAVFCLKKKKKTKKAEREDAPRDRQIGV